MMIWGKVFLKKCNRYPSPSQATLLTQIYLYAQANS